MIGATTFRRRIAHRTVDASTRPVSFFGRRAQAKIFFALLALR